MEEELKDGERKREKNKCLQRKWREGRGNLRHNIRRRRKRGRRKLEEVERRGKVRTKEEKKEESLTR